MIKREKECVHPKERLRKSVCVCWRVSEEVRERERKCQNEVRVRAF